MGRPSSRPVSTRTASKTVSKGKSVKPSRSKSSEPQLPEDDDDFRPKGRKKKRSAEQNRKQSSGARENFEEKLEDIATELTGIIMDEEGEEGKNKKQVASVFEREFKKIKKALDDNVDMDQGVIANGMFRASFKMVADLLPIAERNYRNSQKESAAYALVALQNQARDLSNDVKLSEDIDGKLLVVDQLIKSAFVRIANLMLIEKFSMHRSMDALTSDGRVRKAMRKHLDDMVVSVAKGMVDYQNLMQLQVSMYLKGDPDYLNPGDPTNDMSNPDKKNRKKRTSKKKK